jgi:hypothetical protein
MSGGLAANRRDPAPERSRIASNMRSGPRPGLLLTETKACALLHVIRVMVDSGITGPYDSHHQPEL